MKRRKFIQNLLTGSPLFLMSSLAFAKNQNIKTQSNTNGKKVIVIGAGISGLTTANKLKEHGYNVIILESQEKVGGRLRTNRSFGIPFDEGASWIHGTKGNPITKLAQQSGMETFHTVDTDRKSYGIGGILINPEIYDDVEDKLYSIFDKISKKGNLDQSFETLFYNEYPVYKNNLLIQFFLSTYITFDTGDLNNLPSLLFNEGKEFGGIETIATNGYDTIANYLAKDLNIKFNQRVSEIDYSQAKIKVTHGSSISEADYVVVTVPLGILKKNTIKFIPDLTKVKKNAIDKIGMNCVNKFLLIWDKKFWDNVQYISYTPKIKDKFNYFVNVNKIKPSVNALMTFAYADYARQTETMNDKQIVNEIMLHLKDIYGSSIPFPKHLLRTKWNTNENFYGSYSYTAVGTEMHHFEDLAEEINDRIFFAGEHTEVDYFSTVHGAYLSAIREVDKIKKNLL